jgi:hypothetical protein
MSQQSVPHRSRWLRRLGCLVIGLGLFAAFPSGCCLVRGAWWRFELACELRDAASIRIEQFTEARGPAVQSVELDGPGRDELRRLAPAVHSRSLPIALRLCFVPHHRVIAKRADGTEWTWLICFTCTESKIGDWDPSPMTEKGALRLVEFFRSRGIPVDKTELEQ